MPGFVVKGERDQLVKDRMAAFGEKVTGITTMRMTEKLDAGDILLQRTTPIGEEETAGELEARVAEIRVDNRRTPLTVTASTSRFSPNADGRFDAVDLNTQAGVSP